MILFTFLRSFECRLRFALTKFTTLSLILTTFCCLFTTTITAAELSNNLSVSIDEKTLNLYKQSIRGNNFGIHLWNSNGYSEMEELPEIRTYIGTVEEEPNSIVVAYISTDGKITAMAFNQTKGHSYYWKKNNIDISDQIENPFAAKTKPIQPSASPKNGSLEPNLNGGPKVPSGVAENGVHYGELVEAELAMDILFKSYNKFEQNIDNIVAYYEYLTLSYDLMMTRDVLIRVPLSHMVIRTEQFYENQSSPGLGNVRKEWNKSPLLDTPWDMVWASQGWVAWGGSIGKGGYPFSTGALYHENGHNWGAFHLAYMHDTMGGNQPCHGPYSVDIVLKTRKKSIDKNHLSQGKPYPFALHPHTHVDVAKTNQDQSVKINVLSNDHDANGDNLKIVEFTTTTNQGGIVSLNEDGSLQYIPAPGYIGKDMIVYTIQDDSPLALQARDIVHIEVVNNDLSVHYDFEQSTGTLANPVGGVGIAADLNGANFETDSVPSPIGKGIRVYGHQNENNIEGHNWSGILAGNGSILPVQADNRKQASPFDAKGNQHSGFYDPMDGNYSFAIWFNFDSYQSDDFHSWGHYLAAKWWHMEQRTGWDLRAIDGKLSLGWRIFDGATGKNKISYNYDFEPGKWYHAVAVFDQDNNEARIYLNGDLVATKTDAFKSNKYIFNGRAPLMIAPFSSQKGLVDDVRIYSKALNDTDVNKLYDLAGDKLRFLQNNFEYTLNQNSVISDNLLKKIWTPTGCEIRFKSNNLPDWLKLSKDGYLYGTTSGISPGVYTAEVVVFDACENRAQTTISINVTKVTGKTSADIWTGISGTRISNLTSEVTFPEQPNKRLLLDGFYLPSHGNNTGAKITGLLTPIKSGDYTFWIASDDQGELSLSNDNSPANITSIASVNGWTNNKQWDKYNSQQSAPIPLQAGQQYYIQALQKNGSGNNHLAVAWAIDNDSPELIDGSSIEPYEINYSLAPAPDSNISLEDISVAKTEIKSQLEAINLSLGNIVYIYDPAIPSGEIIGFIAPNGSMLLPGTTMDLLISKGAAELIGTEEEESSSDGESNGDSSSTPPVDNSTEEQSEEESEGGGGSTQLLMLFLFTAIAIRYFKK